MSKLLQSIGLITVIIVCLKGIKYVQNNYHEFNIFLQGVGVIALISFLFFISIRIFFGKTWRSKFAKSIVGVDLIGSIEIFLSELPNPSKAAIAGLVGHLIYRITRFGVFAFLIAILPTILLWQQNQKLEEQTILFDKQNNKIDSQIEIEDSSRRGNLIVMMSNIMDEMSSEIQILEERTDTLIKNISPQLTGRVAALSYSFRPYRFWQDTSLVKHKLSPERGQFLLALVNSGLPRKSYSDIYRISTFEKAYLEKANLMEANLIDAILTEANLAKANLVDANLTRALLINTNLRGADLRNAYLEKANLRGADLRKAELEDVYLKDANLTNVKVEFSDWIEKLEDWDVEGINYIKRKYIVGNWMQEDDFGFYYLLEEI